MTALEYRRSSRGLTIRADEASRTVHFSGYACVYDFEYDVAGGVDQGGWVEVVTRQAGRLTLAQKPDVRLLINHEGLPLARTSRQTMTLAEDDSGLFADAPTLDLRNPKVQELESVMDRGDADEMSFAFRVAEQKWNGDYTHRTILTYDLAVKGADVSLVTYPANDATVAQIRTAAAIDELRAAVRGGVMDVRMARHIVDRIRDAQDLIRI